MSSAAASITMTAPTQLTPHAWTEAVLFENGYEKDNIFGEDEFFCDWEFEYDENEYIVHVIREGGTDSE